MFENLKVVELASVLAGPLVGTFFAELGAEVIKIENKYKVLVLRFYYPIEFLSIFLKPFI
jgi:crotonobetainyl-CoA:carnitine CoA-transferase CaiB-like acyl-CoA transferase